jgi:hypothetical protein
MRGNGLISQMGIKAEHDITKTTLMLGNKAGKKDKGQ